MPTPHDHQDIRIESGSDTNDVGGVYFSTEGGWRWGSERIGPPVDSSTPALLDSTSLITYRDDRGGTPASRGEVWFRTLIKYPDDGRSLAIVRSFAPSGTTGTPSAPAASRTYSVRSSNAVELTVEVATVGMGGHRWRPITDFGTSESRWLTLVLEDDRGVKVLSSTLHIVIGSTKPTS